MTPERIACLMAQGHRWVRDEMLTDAELLHFLRCAKAVAELEKWLEADARRSITLNGLRIKGVASDLLTALESALEKAKQ